MAIKTSTKEAYKMIKQKILSCEYEPDQFVSEKEIVEQLDLSRTPIREAINILNGEGLLKIIPKKGLQVAPLSIKNIKEIYDIRILIEPLAVQQAIKYIKQDDIKYLVQLDNNLNDYFNKKDASVVFKAGMDIHLHIARLSNNETIFSLIKMLRDRSQRGYVYYLQKSFDMLNNEDRKAIEKSLLGNILSIHSKFIKSLIELDAETTIHYITEDLTCMKNLFAGF